MPRRNLGPVSAVSSKTSEQPNRSFTVRLAQVNPALGDVRRNLDMHLAHIDAAVAERVQLIVFPELSLTGYYLRDLVPDVALRLESPEVKSLAERSTKLSIVVGLVEETPDFDFHVAALYLEGGQVRHVHRKVYLPTYGMFDEERYYGVGDRIRAFDTGLGRCAMLICEDLWHPSAAYVASRDRMQYLIAPSDSPVRGITSGKPEAADAYDAMLSTYARLFQVYVFFANRVGYEEGVSFWGGSQIIDPTGETVAQAAYLEEAQLTATIDVGAVRRARARSPLLSDERMALTLRELQRIHREDFED
ncbi:MAG: nitrilase-related carbon-nitrogen hydrolase [Armatimonadota bacterium]